MYGFRIGFSWAKPLSLASRNIPSAYQHPEVVSTYIEKEVSAGNFIGLLLLTTKLAAGPSIHISRIGVIPKGHNLKKFRIITDLSYPSGRSVNDGISAQWCSLVYTSVDKVATAVLTLGRGSLLAKVDIKSAYRLIPVHPSNRPLLGIRWQGHIFVETKLPFGLRSVPKVFNAVADALEWCYRLAGVTAVDHYLDDFITMGPPNSDMCAKNLETIKAVSRQLGVPLAEEKCEGPTTNITFLGINIDTERQLLTLPLEKLVKLQETLKPWTSKRWCRRRELESLIGLLHHAARVVILGRSFLHRLILYLRGGRHENHFIRLNRGIWADIQWWQLFAELWNGTSLCPVGAPDVVMVSNASGSWGCGAFTETRWFQVQWPENCRGQSITFKELFPIVLALVVWGRQWRGSHLHCRCDNQAVVHTLASRYSHNSNVMHLLRCMFFLEACYDSHISASHIVGADNGLADALSHNNTVSFFLQAPGMEPHPTPLPLMALDLLLDFNQTWLSPTWINLFRFTVR